VRIENGKPTIRPLDLDKIIKKRELALNLDLKADDVVFVPQRGQRGLTLNDIVAPLSVIRLFMLGS